MFNNENELVFLQQEIKEKKSGDGVFYIVNIGDPLAMENYSFFCNEPLGNEFARGDKVNVSLTLGKRGFNLVPQLASLVRA